MHCEANDIGMAMIGSEEVGVCLVILGKREFHPDYVSIACAHMLLEGILSGGFSNDNKAAAEAEKEAAADKSKLN